MIELEEAVVGFLGEEVEERGGEVVYVEGMALLMRVWTVGVEEWRYVGTGLRDDEMVYVEEFGDSAEGGVAVGIFGLAPGVEGDFLA